MPVSNGAARPAARRGGPVRALLLSAVLGLPLFGSLIFPSCCLAAPSTFGPVIGSALLCRSHLDNAYFYSYLAAAFGPFYKHEGGAYWFKADGTLWNTSISDVMVSDDTSELTFVGVVAEATPSGLDEAIVNAVGVHHRKTDSSAFSPLESNPGSRIVYFNNRSKMYCAKFKPLPVAP